MNPIQKVDTKALKEYRDRWNAVADIERNELQRTSLDKRWRQLNLLFHFARKLSAGKKFQHEDRDLVAVRERWHKLKAGYL
jgi:hypothetical protein